MASGDTKEVATDLLPLLRHYKDGTVERFIASPYIPPSPLDPATGVSSKDVTISPLVSARLYLPASATQKLPVLVYFHGGGFCIESAFSLFNHRYVNALASESNAVAVSVEYRLAPENPLPAAYDDSWAALQWVAYHSVDRGTDDKSQQRDSWLAEHADFDRLFIGGDSAGANIVHHLAIRAGSEPLPGDLKILGAFLAQPYFWGSDPVGSESPDLHTEENLIQRIWTCVYPSAPGGIDNPAINPFSPDAPSVAALGCARLLVCVSGEDELRERGIRYLEEVKRSGWRGEKIELFEVEGEGHAFHFFGFGSENAKRMITRLASFVSQTRLASL
uniref:CXE carboxylesterase n=1 Tax=Actinidia eriantha TaxID=165200 RepID=Q0ZPU7_ACTER|nr:CXE carboxylesterase [Actinidia eriantha]